MQLLEREGCALSLASQARLLGLNRSGLYYQPAGGGAQELELRRRIDEIYTKWPFCGSRRLAAELRRQGLAIHRKLVQRLMREMGIAAIYPGPNLSRRRQQAQVRPYLLRGLAITVPDAVWAIDLTYVPLRRSWMYLVAVMDWVSRRVAGWAIGRASADGVGLGGPHDGPAASPAGPWSADPPQRPRLPVHGQSVPGHAERARDQVLHEPQR
jgi:putative transposase